MSIKLKRTLYVGLGGTGVSTILKVKKCFIDSYGEVPPMIGFLAIDTDKAAFNKEITSNLGHKIKLENNELLVCSVQNALAVYRNNPQVYDWVPTQNVGKLSSIAGNGAGQVRSNGRFIAYYNHNQIVTAIQSAVTRICQLIPETSPYRVDLNINGIEHATTINVFSSVAGGTGSGMLVDALCLIKSAVTSQSINYNLYPWIVLPDVFRAMNTGPAMGNVYYNSFGALRSLDYLAHHEPNLPAINFGYDTINDKLFNYAFIVNNRNTAGVAFTELNDITDVIAKSAFLPANKMGDEIASPFDNIIAQQDGGTYDILNKKAWAASTGSAELIYDSNMVAWANAYHIITKLCDSMLSAQTNGSDEANKFVDHQDVMIRENDGRNDVIDALLNPMQEYTITLDENSTIDDINNYLDYNVGNRVDQNILSALNVKLERSKDSLDSYISTILNDTQSGCVDAAHKFVHSLLTILNCCKGEMEEEYNTYKNQNAIPQDWEPQLNSIKASGLRKYITGKVNEEAVDLLQNNLSNFVISNREEKRRFGAISFYNSFITYVNKKEQELQQLKNAINGVNSLYTDKLLALQQNASSTSKFQIFLHKEDVLHLNFEVNASMKSDFHKHFSETGGINLWLNLSKEQISEQILNFVKNTLEIKKVLNTKIDNVLSQMSEQQIKSYLDQLKVLASPLWVYNTQGFNKTTFELDKFVIVGVGNRDTSFLSTNSILKSYFDTNGNRTSFASTQQYDRIYLLVVEDLLPIYAINNFSTYKADADIKTANNLQLASYIDEKLNNRIIAENFDIMPTIERDNILQYWVWGFVFDYIHFDIETGYYWIKSKSKGDAIKGYRFNLSQQRDVAYEIFKTEGLYKEVEESLERIIKIKGNEQFELKIQDVKDNGTYFEEYSQLSPLEKSNIDEHRFRAVRNLVSQEIGLMTN